jgi:AcrR family transcriptional regulator
MPEDVKRAYQSTRRAEQAAETRRAVVWAAADLFVERGYGATTIDAVAAAAGVSRKTVFTAVGGKADLIKLAVDWTVAGDDDEATLRDRPAMQEILAADDGVTLLTRWAHALVAIGNRVAGLSRALEVAAEGGDEARKLLEMFQQQRLSSSREIIKRLAALGALAPELTRADAVDIAWFATDPVLHDRFVRVRGWSAKRFDTWLARLLVTQLLG